MARGHYLSLEEARKLGKLDQFAREHDIPPEEQHPEARGRFQRLLDLACKSAKSEGSKDKKNVRDD